VPNWAFLSRVTFPYDLVEAPTNSRPPPTSSSITMAAATQGLRMAPGLSSLLPRVSAPVVLSSSRWATLYAHEVSHPLLPRLSIGFPGIAIRLPSFVEDIWEAILKAVPKKKTSHSKKRHRQMAGKALEDMHSFCRCPGCGQTKRMHRLCSHCMKSRDYAWPVGRFRS
jgi:large subunit ribosomal protein L32